MTNPAQAILCPYCGCTQMAVRDRCTDCGGLFEPLSRVATQIAMGPWYIRDRANPFRPGCCYDVLKRQIQAGKIKPTTIIRGPTTRQFWSVARNVPGVAHLLGVCHHCGAPVERGKDGCPNCQSRFSDAEQRNELGLDFPTTSEARAAHAALDRQIATTAPPSVTPQAQADAPAIPDLTDPPSANHPLHELRHAHGGSPASPEALTQLADATVTASPSTDCEDAAALVAAAKGLERESADEQELPLASPATGQALDFGPSETAVSWRELLRRINPLSWGLIVVNACLFVLLIVLLVNLLASG